MQLTAIRGALGALLLTVAVAAQNSLPLLLGQLGSSDWKLRSQAVEQIAKAPLALQDSQMRSELLSTLDKENLLLRSTHRLGWQKSLLAASMEAFGEYYSELLGLVSTFADYDSPDTLRILAQGSYNSDSKFAEKLAQHVDGFLPTLIEDSNSDIPVIRFTTVDFIGEILHKFRPRALKAEGASQLMQALAKRARIDDAEDVRRQALAGLRNLADVNGDGKVDCVDLAIVTASLDKKPGEAGFDARADIGFRGAVGKEEAAYVSQYLPLGTRCEAGKP